MFTLSRRHRQAIAFSTLLIVGVACNFPSRTEPPVSLSAPPSDGPALREPDPQVVALRQLQADSETEADLDFEHGFPTFVKARIAVSGDDAVERALNYLDHYGDLYVLDNPDFDIEVRRVSALPGGIEIVVFYQSYKGVPVFTSELVVNVFGEQVFATVGNMLTEADVDVSPTITVQQAEHISRQDLNLPGAIVAGVSSPMIFDYSLLSDELPDPRLTWRVTFMDPEPWRVFIDAHTGEVLNKYLLAESAFELNLRDAGGARANNTTCFTNTTLDTFIADEDGISDDFSADIDALSAFGFTQNAYDFYLNTFGRDSYDKSGAELEVYVRAGVPNARWNSLCGVIQFAIGWVSDDLMTHEMTHGVINLTYQNQSGALNESFSDIMAVLSDPADWTIAEDRTSGAGAIRDISDPVAFSQPDVFSNYVVLPVANDSGGVHTNSGILNKAAFLIWNGGDHNGWSVEGIGSGKMGALFYMSMVSLPNNAGLMQAGSNIVTLADLVADFGLLGNFDDHDACQVRNAFAAVELGDGDADCDGVEDERESDNDDDFIPDSQDNCPNIANPGQDDVDMDGIGDACDDDFDNDGVRDRNDNCPTVPNPNQNDIDVDAIGDVCEDADGDDVFDPVDNCPADANPDQEDTNDDRVGDACTDDDDGDGVSDSVDNCPQIYNAGQEDEDGDSVGDECDNCKRLANDQSDIDGDTLGDACDGDMDGDGVPNVEDNCPRTPNPTQFDPDRNGVGLGCDKAETETILGLIKNDINVVIHFEQREEPYLLLPLPVCRLDCPDWLPEDYLVSMVITDLPVHTSVWIMDEFGEMAGRSPVVDRGTVLRFRPKGGVDYYLSVAFGSEYPQGEPGEFSMSMSAGPSTEQPLPPQREPDPSFGPPPPLSEEGPVDGSPEATVETGAFCRQGPGTEFPDITALSAGTLAKIEGRNDSQPRWWYVNVSTANQRCWISDSIVDTTGDLDSVPVLPAPPLPITVTPTATVTPVPPSAPDVPSALNITNSVCVSNGPGRGLEVSLAWTDNANNEAGYRVYRGGGLLATLGMNATSYTDDAPNTATPYTYSVEAFNGVGTSAAISVQSALCPLG